MRVVVLGGAGDMGSRAVEDLAVSQGVSAVTIADRDVAGARRVAESLRDAGADVAVTEVDATDHEALVRAMRGHDVAASALGPFHRFEAPMVRAALAAGVDYASICDEADAARGVFERFDEEARTRGRTVLTGLGASPGLSNVCVRLLSRRFDHIRRVDISVYQPFDAGGGEAVFRHMLHIMSGDIAAWRGGRGQQVRACSERRVVDFPRYGRFKVWNMGHAEPHTVPKSFPDIDEVGFYLGFGRGTSALVGLARLGAFAGRRREDLTVRAMLALDAVTRPAKPGWGALRIDAWGDKDGVETHHLLCGIGEMRETTGLSLSVGAQMLGRGELLDRGGVFAPEGCIEPTTFLEALRSKGIEAFEDVAMTRPLVA